MGNKAGIKFSKAYGEMPVTEKSAAGGSFIASVYLTC